MTALFSNSDTPWSLAPTGLPWRPRSTTWESVASHGRPSEAEPLIRKAADLNASLVQARRNLVLALADQGHRAAAAKALAEAIQATGMQPQYEDLTRDLGGSAILPR